MFYVKLPTFPMPALKEGKNRSDAYGGGTGEYFRLGANSITEPTTATT